jgi:hypothetical protein
MVGVHWDISWHRSIGRDTFWTPAHIAIYLCGVLGGIASAFMILWTTFGKGPAADSARAASVRIWGFRGPIGAFIMAWGGIAMLASAPFDDWWHNAYGLDVRIISPPHTVLATGLFSVMLGALLAVTGRMNRTQGSERRALEWLYVYLGGMVLVNIGTFIMEETFQAAMHRPGYYRATANALPLFLVGLAVASPMRWAATRIATVYMLFWAGINWILPLFPAEPKLGPVMHPVTHFVPSFFPLLLVVPGVALDLILSRTPHWPSWRRAALAGVAFVACVLAVQWPFGNFLMSDWGQNWFFYGNARDFRTGSTSFSARRMFVPGDMRDVWPAFLAAPLMSWIGLQWGAWLRSVRR